MDVWNGYGKCFGLDELKKGNTSQLKPLWVSSALDRCLEIISNDSFPCLFGIKAVKTDTVRVVFASEARASENLAEGILQYLSAISGSGIKLRIQRPLLVIFEKDDFSSLAEEQRYGWSILQSLHESDSSPWPSNIAKEVTDPNWSFCFDNVPLFVNMSFPKHKIMRSRNLGERIVFVINPRENFDFVAPGATLSGRRIRARIRARSIDYNKGVETAALGAYGDQGSLEIKQYQLEELGSLSYSNCPFNMKL